jgi:hypothetical protein
MSHHHEAPEPDTDQTTDPATHWENRYRGRGQTWSGRPNEALVREVADINPGRALDLGCGEGGDAIWLAGRGWSVTAVDISPFDLVSAQFLHSLVELPREEILRRGASAVAPGGLLVVVGHAEVPPWSHHAHDAVELPTPDSELAALALPSDSWTVLTRALVNRQATTPDGGTAPVVDSVVTLRRHER